MINHTTLLEVIAELSELLAETNQALGSGTTVLDYRQSIIEARERADKAERIQRQLSDEVRRFDARQMVDPFEAA